MNPYDVLIIGAGVSGCAVARALSRYQLRVGVLEKEEDVCCGTSKANSAIVHAGFDAKPNTLMAKLNVQGNQMMETLCDELDVPFERNGAMVLCSEENGFSKLEALYEQGIANQVTGLRILAKDEVLSMEPNVNEEVFAALYAPTSGIIDPFWLNAALAENAFTNGVSFFFDTPVEAVEKNADGYAVKTPNEVFQTRFVVNAAGVYADQIHHMVSEVPMAITPRRGEYCLLDSSAGSHVAHTIFALPSRYGKGVLVSPTVHGNLLVGPTAEDLDEKDDTSTSAKGLSSLMEKAGHSVSRLPFYSVITSFSGLRACETGHEFVVGEVKDASGFFNCAGIESPGLSSCPAIGETIANLIVDQLQPEPNADFCGKRKGLLRPSTLSIQQQNDLIAKQPAYGQIICRCEKVTEGEILDAIHRPIGAKSLDGIKRRTRAGMGRCQSGFCAPRVMEILARECYDGDMTKVTKSGGQSFMVDFAKGDVKNENL